MERVEVEQTPAEAWQASLNATCNRLSTQYLNLLRATSSATALEISGSGSQDPRSGGGIMVNSKEPPPPLAADAAVSSLQAQLAVQNMCVATSQLLDLIRTLRLSALLMDEDTIAREEQDECMDAEEITKKALEEAGRLESQLLNIRNNELNMQNE